MVTIAAVDPPNTVFKTAMDEATPSPGFVIDDCDPLLKAKNPVKRIKPPRDATCRTKSNFEVFLLFKIL